ncbi:MAG: hypothetical protein Q9201_004545 [Fulgogasparrea decipioides]
MDEFVPRKKQKLLFSHEHKLSASLEEAHLYQDRTTQLEDENDSTDLKLATLVSLFPEIQQATLLDILIASDGSTTLAIEALSSPAKLSPRKRSASGIGYQTSLAGFKQARAGSSEQSQPISRKALTRKGHTLHLYTPEDIEAHTPCSIIHSFLPAHVAEDLLKELLQEAPTFERQVFKLFENVVQSPHSACFYVESLEERERQQTEYLYNGSYLTVSLYIPVMSYGAGE